VNLRHATQPLRERNAHGVRQRDAVRYVAVEGWGNFEGGQRLIEKILGRARQVRLAADALESSFVFIWVARHDQSFLLGRNGRHVVIVLDLGVRDSERDERHDWAECVLVESALLRGIQYRMKIRLALSEHGKRT
jgi:hypothetical protein